MPSSALGLIAVRHAIEFPAGHLLEAIEKSFSPGKKLGLEVTRKEIHKDKFYPSHFREEYNRRIARAEAIKHEIARREMPRLPAPKKGAPKRPQRHILR